MIRDARTTEYVRPENWANWSEREHELHVHYASNAIAVGHAEDCALVTTALNWPTILGRPECNCNKGAQS